MDPHLSDPLVSSQQRVFTQIKRSHRLFMGQMYAGILSMPLFAIFFIIFGSTLLDITGTDNISILSPLIGLIAVPIFGAIWQIVRFITFARESTRYFYEVEHTPDPSQLIIGLTRYVNRLVNFMQPQILLDRKSPTTLSESLKKLESRLNKQIYFVIATIAGLGLFIFNIQIFFSRSGYPIHPSLIIIIGALITAYAALLWLTNKWRPLAKQWIQGFYALTEWGENLERLYQQTSPGGDDL